MTAWIIFLRHLWLPLLEDVRYYSLVATLQSHAYHGCVATRGRTLPSRLSTQLEEASPKPCCVVFRLTQTIAQHRTALKRTHTHLYNQQVCATSASIT